MPARFARRPAVALLVLCLGAYGYFYQAGGWNQNSRFDLVRSIVELRTSKIDAYYRNTGDLSCRGPDGRCRRPNPARGKHAYCDKAPGVSWLAVPAYTAVYIARGGEPRRRQTSGVAAHISTVWAIALPSAIAVAMLYLLLAVFGLSVYWRAGFALAYGLATLAFPYATVLYGHQLMAALVVIALSLLVRQRHLGTGPPRPLLLAAAGALLGYAVVVEYPAALAVVPVCIYATVFVRPWQRLGYLFLGMAVPGLALAAYHWSVFGSPLALPYDFSTQPHRGQGFFMGLALVPDWGVVGQILVSDYRGLFYSAPWLVLAVPGLVVLFRRARFRAEAGVCLAVVLLFLWLNASLVDWQGGWAMGPRYLVPAIPFLAIGAAGVALLPVRRMWQKLAATAVGGALVIYSAVHMLAGVAVKPEVPVYIKKPFSQFLFKHFWAGELSVNTQSIDSIAPSRSGERFAWNLGEIMGLDGAATLIPLAVFTIAVAAWLWWALRAQSVERQI
ncbi:hypothetical protein [Haliangium sp.]|uniref:hypothetical protein n=1 Tax=Haliangium sp. TaxID=2663208 RepID=UPI003D0E5FDB